ncbi:nuclear transport factor 2 family protein [Actinacidiphila glaucinigra]
MAEPTTAAERQPGTEPDLAALRARVACLDVIDAIFRWVDAGEAARTVELFTPDGELVMGRWTRPLPVTHTQLRPMKRNHENSGSIPIRRAGSPARL